MQQKKERIGMTLSGGGARGIAHIGVLQAFREADIVPDILSGTSAGAIVGALHAAGYSPEAMLDFVKDTSIWRIFTVNLPYDGLTKLTYLKKRLEECIVEDSFESLRHPLFISVANLNSGSLRTMHRGPLFDAVVASCSIPLVFKPVEMDGELYVDGGLLDNLPVEPLLSRAEVIVGVNVMPTLPVKNKSIQTVFGIATRCFELSVFANSRKNLESCDLVVTPEQLDEYNIFQFNKYREIYQIGYEAGQEAVPGVKRLLQTKKAAG